MAYMIPTMFGALDQMGTSYTVPAEPSAIGTQRLPTDALFYATVTLLNIVVGSRYRIEYHNGASWVLLREGTAAATTVEETSVPAYSNPMLVRARIRKSSASPKYFPLDTFGYLVRDGVSIYVAQVADEIAS